MADETDDTTTPPEHWRSVTPEASWKELASARNKLAAERQTAKAAGARVAELEGLLNQIEPKVQRVQELEGTVARMQTRLAMSRLGIVDDDVADIAEARYQRYVAQAGKDATSLDTWLADAAKADKILSPFLQPAAPAAQAAAPLPAVPVVPQPVAPTRTNGTTSDEIARVRAANNGRIPKELQKEIGTRIDLSDLLGARR
jgi:hypothetical protein